MLIKYLYGPTYFSNDFRNDCGDDVPTKICCNASLLIYKRSFVLNPKDM